jgi:hypothetical protein
VPWGKSAVARQTTADGGGDAKKPVGSVGLRFEFRHHLDVCYATAQLWEFRIGLAFR